MSTSGKVGKWEGGGASGESKDMPTLHWPQIKSTWRAGWKGEQDKVLEVSFKRPALVKSTLEVWGWGGMGWGATIKKDWT